jgi:hypothetical protein
MCLYLANVSSNVSTYSVCIKFVFIFSNIFLNFFLNSVTILPLLYIFIKQKLTTVFPHVFFKGFTILYSSFSYTMRSLVTLIYSHEIKSLKTRFYLVLHLNTLHCANPLFKERATFV